jgi:hypothetical protein
MVLGGIGLIVAFCVLAVSIRFLNASHATTEITAQAQGPPRFPVAPLEKANGAVLAFAGFAANFIVVVSLVLFAQSVGSEYGWGTLRVVLSREPRRWAVLGGKLAAMTAFIGIAVAAAAAVEVGFATLYASIRHFDMGAWWTLKGFGAMAGAILRVWFTATVWGTFGMLLALALRTAAPAIGIGIGYTFVVENLLGIWWKDGDKWLPGQLLIAFNQGGTDRVSLLVAGLLLVSYATVFLLGGATLFHRRDVAA